jgi:Tfp pilus assembly PilM family ATPase
MSSFFQRGPIFGIEITARAVRTVTLSGSGKDRTITAASSELPAGAVAEAYSLPNIADSEALVKAVRQSLAAGGILPGRAALCLPDALFRTQTLDFDELPARAADRERLIRWRLEKTAAFDLLDTDLRCQILKRPKGITVLACVAKKELIRQHEALLAALGLEAWSILPSSLAVAGFYAPLMAQRSRSYALSHVTGDSLSTLVAENGGVGFFRCKDVKRSGSTDASGRLTRDIADSLHFYAHRDRSQQAELRHLYLSGDRELCDMVASELGTEASLEVRVVSPEQVLPASSGPADLRDFAAALGAGISL